jgi:hypothetical protein
MRPAKRLSRFNPQVTCRVGGRAFSTVCQELTESHWTALRPMISRDVQLGRLRSVARPRACLQASGPPPGVDYERVRLRRLPDARRGSGSLHTARATSRMDSRSEVDPGRAERLASEYLVNMGGRLLSDLGPLFLQLRPSGDCAVTAIQPLQRSGDRPG